MKKAIIIIFFIIILVFTNIYISINIKTDTNVTSISDVYEITTLIQKQRSVDKDLKLISYDKKNSFEKPLLIKNPYGLTPLSYLLIFNTRNKVSVFIKINDEDVMKFKQSKNHFIPIYGLKANYKNKIEIKLSNGKTKIIYIKTDPIDYEKLEITKTYKTNNKLLMTSINTYSSVLYDYNGNIIWYLNSNDYLDTILLSNGNLLTLYDSNDKYSIIIEINYLGKIYNVYKIENRLHHTFYEYDNYYLFLTYSENSIQRNDLIYLVSKKTGEILYKIDLYNIVKSYSESLAKKIKNDEDWAHINSAFLNKKELLVSLRKSNSIFSINIDTMKLNYIVNTTNYWDEKFENYIITGETDILSQHTVFMHKDGSIGIFNNNVSRIKHLIDSVEVYYDKKDSYPMIFNIIDKKVNVKWKYINLKEKIFAPAYSSFFIDENNFKLINYSCLIDEKNGKYYYKDQYMKLNELNNKDEIVFESQKKDSVVAVYKVDIFKNVGYLNLNNNVEIKEVE